MTDSPAPITYQLKVFLIGISPMIWRRFRVNGNSTIADLHYILQIVMGWGDNHLNRFVIHGKYYGVWHLGGISFSDDPDTVRLIDLGLREREKFRYEYDFTDRWHHQLRVEAIQSPEAPEDCGGPWAYLSKRQHYSYGHGIAVLADIRERGAEAITEHYDEIQQLMQWLSLDRFDCNAVNRRLQQYAEGDRDELFTEVIG